MLKEQLPTRAPTVFGERSGVKDPLRTRLTRAINEAKACGWIAEVQEKAYTVGPSARSTTQRADLSRPPESLDDLET
jgi:hypothetical protein